MESLGMDAALYTLAYFTSAWVQPVDDIALPRLRAVLDGVNMLNQQHQLVGLLEVRRTEDADTSEANVQPLEPSTFRSLCKHFQVTDLPACVLLDAQGQALAQGSLKALEVTTSCDWRKKLRQLHEDDVASSTNTSDLSCKTFYMGGTHGKVLGELLQDNGSPAAAWETLRPLWQIDVGSNFPTPLDVDDPALVKMREEALKLFETGNFLPAASSFVKVLLRCPTCTKSSFNLAVILQTIGETHFAVSSMLRVVALDDSDSVAHTVL
ncbi:hypothetical protein PHPALM_29835, partial [Phytophthora palmivora]